MWNTHTYRNIYKDRFLIFSMGKTQYQKAKKLLQNYKEKNNTDKITGEDLIKEISINIGSDTQRTVLPYIKLMTSLGLVIDTKEGLFIRC